MCITLTDLKSTLGFFLFIQTALFAALCIAAILTNVVITDYYVYDKLKVFFEKKILSVFRYILSQAPIVVSSDSDVQEFQQRIRAQNDLPPTYSEITESNNRQTSTV